MSIRKQFNQYNSIAYIYACKQQQTILNDE
jgi:hypothetical protein